MRHYLVYDLTIVEIAAFPFAFVLIREGMSFVGRPEALRKEQVAGRTGMVILNPVGVANQQVGLREMLVNSAWS